MIFDQLFGNAEQLTSLECHLKAVSSLFGSRLTEFSENKNLLFTDLAQGLKEHIESRVIEQVKHFKALEGSEELRDQSVRQALASFSKFLQHLKTTKDSEQRVNELAEVFLSQLIAQSSEGEIYKIFKIFLPQVLAPVAIEKREELFQSTLAKSSDFDLAETFLRSVFEVYPRFQLQAPTLDSLLLLVEKQPLFGRISFPLIFTETLDFQKFSLLVTRSMSTS